jgi:1,4-alpha-glucan branching enzyme
VPVSQAYIHRDTPMGANLVADGAAFRVWAPNARRVHVVGNLGGGNDWTPHDSNLLTLGPRGHWTGFVPGVRDGDHYKFFVEGRVSAGLKRDPYARELSSTPAYPRSNCIVRNPKNYPWHDADWRPPRFNDLVIYQLHIGTFWGPNLRGRVATFLDLVDRLDYLVDLGVNAIEPLPIGEFAAPRSRGYGGSDLFSPEMDYTLEGAEVDHYLPRVNAHLARHGQPALTLEQVRIPINQLKILIDLCHLKGIAVLFDVVFNHAGSEIRTHDEGLWFFDRADSSDPNHNLYFTDQDWTGPVFAFWKEEVRQFLIDNATFFLDEYHVDGFRYDEASVIDRSSPDGWRLLQDCTSTARYRDASAVHIAEYWNVNPAVVRTREQGGAGFDATWNDGLRENLRRAVESAARGREAWLDLHAVAASLRKPGFSALWRSVECIENHDEVYVGREPRLAALADGSDRRSWFARSRSRVATGLLLTAPGIPLLFMGQEVLEDKQWSDNPAFDAGSAIYWDGLGSDRAMSDHLRFTRELIKLRLRHPALRGEGLNVFDVDPANRVLAFQRWVEGLGRDVVVVATFSETTLYNYRLGFPRPGRWLEVFNSDVYDNWVNPLVAGNGGEVEAWSEPMHSLPATSTLVIPANSLLVFATDTGD